MGDLKGSAANFAENWVKSGYVLNLAAFV